MFIKYKALTLDSADNVVETTEIAPFKAIGRSNDHYGRAIIVLGDNMCDLVLGIYANSYEYMNLLDTICRAIKEDRQLIELKGLCFDNCIDFDENEDADKLCQIFYDKVQYEHYSIDIIR